MFTELARRCGRKHPPSFRTSTLQHSEVLLPNVARPVTDAQKSFCSAHFFFWVVVEVVFAALRLPSKRTHTHTSVSLDRDRQTWH